jgi:very-short-patch-repair endonuclease
VTAKTSFARRLRRNQTDAERALWFRLRDRRLNGLKFKRQVPIDKYIVDFCCAEAKLIDVLQNTEGVLEEILNTIGRHPQEPPHPVPLPSGERGRCGSTGA